MDHKITTVSRLKKILKRRPGKKVVFTNGCFDILHHGHVKYLKEARSKGDLLIVGLNSDKSVRRIKPKGRPINRQKDRAAVLAALESVDHVVLFNEETPYRLITALRPDVLVKGADWPKKKIIGAQVVLACGGKVITIPTLRGRSTTNIINKILKRP